MPIFVPDFSHGYFDQSFYERFRSQSFKEDFWAYQYLQLVDMARKPIDDYLVTTTVPSGLSTYAILTDKPSWNDEASNDFARATKLDMYNKIARGNLTLPPVFCKDPDCTLGFPVNKTDWTANAITGFLI